MGTNLPETTRRHRSPHRARLRSLRGIPLAPRSAGAILLGNPTRKEALAASLQELTERGEYSWTADIRARVRIARTVSRSEAEFRSILGTMGVTVADNSPKAERRDWIYAVGDLAELRSLSGAVALIEASHARCLDDLDTLLKKDGDEATPQLVRYVKEKGLLPEGRPAPTIRKPKARTGSRPAGNRPKSDMAQPAHQNMQERRREGSERR